MAESFNGRAAPRPETRQRSVGELKQLLGVRDIAELMIGETPPDETVAFLDVSAPADERPHWKPRLHAESRSSEKGTLRVALTDAEAEALTAAGATRVR